MQFDTFANWWNDYTTKLHQSRQERGLHPVSLSQLSAMQEAARAAWTASVAQQKVAQQEFEMDDWNR